MMSASTVWKQETFKIISKNFQQILVQFKNQTEAEYYLGYKKHKNFIAYTDETQATNKDLKSQNQTKHPHNIHY